jgi:hypothetical protein
MGNYPHHRRQPATFWMVRPHAAIDTPPLPVKTAARVRGIRQIFLEQFGGRATLLDLGDACYEAGLLAGLSTHGSAAETIKAALRPIATTDWWQSAQRAAQVNAMSASG